jgi:outer membrane protein insertion porin family
VDRLGFFTEVNVETQEVPGSPDQVDLTVNVAEKPTGSLQLGAGYSSAEKVALTFGISQENVFGSGNFLGVSVNTSKYNRTLSVTTTDPYFTKDGISRTISVYHTTTRPYSTTLDGDYKLVNQGASIRFGVPFSEVDTIFFGVGLERYAFDPNSTTSFSGLYTPNSYLRYFQCERDATGLFVTGCDQKSVWGVPLTIGWGRDSRDSALIPTTGRLQRANLELGAAGDMKYVKTNYQYQQFFAINKQYTFAINGEVGYAKALGGKVYPIFKNFYAGGLGSIRGFEQNSLGPRDVPLFGQTEGAALGGTKKAIFNAELSTPFPGAGNDRTLRLYGFFDVGNVFGSRAAGLTDEQYKAQKKLRASVGLGISWISPLGPLRLAYAFPVKSQKEVLDPTTGFVVIPKDRIQRLQFQIGTSF